MRSGACGATAVGDACFFRIRSWLAQSLLLDRLKEAPDLAGLRQMVHTFRCRSVRDHRDPFHASALSVRKNSAGKVRGHASLMRPTSHFPGVPFVCLPLCDGPKVLHRTQRLPCEGGVIQNLLGS